METALPRTDQFSVAVDSRDRRVQEVDARSRATKEANQAGCESECNRYRHYDGQPASPTAGARRDRRVQEVDARSRATKEANQTGCESEYNRYTRTMTGSPLRRLQELAKTCAGSRRSVASD